jgi:hypothetical protein
MKPTSVFGRYERHTDGLLPRSLFVRRLRQHALLTAAVILGSLAIGILGYHLTEDLSWLDSLLNASMILGGMGPVDPVRTDAGKWFASAYALYSGLVVLIAASILIAPIAHRILHRMHLQEDEQTGKPQR